MLYRLDQTIKPSIVKRISKDGPHGKTGEKHCFKLNCSIEFGGIFEIEVKRYFIKGYFFDDENLSGFTIQSFRLDE